MIGVDISDHSIKIMQLSNDHKRKYLGHCTSDVPDGAIKRGFILEQETVRKCFQETLTKCRIDSKINDSFIFSIPETQTFLRVIEIPEMQEDEIGEAIKWEVAQHIPLGLENMYIDWQPITHGAHPTKGNRREIQVGAAQRKLVDALYDTLKPLGLDIGAFELESQAITRSLISEELRDKQGIVIVDLGGTATNVIVHDHGALRFTATLPKGLDDTLSSVSQDERSAIENGKGKLTEEEIRAAAPQLTAVNDELAGEVLSIAEFYSGIDTSHVVHEILLTGGGANVPGLDKAFLKHFENVHVQRGNPWVNVLGDNGSTRVPMDVKESIRYSTALGLAMRQVLR